LSLAFAEVIKMNILGKVICACGVFRDISLYEKASSLKCPRTGIVYLES